MVLIWRVLATAFFAYALSLQIIAAGHGAGTLLEYFLESVFQVDVNATWRAESLMILAFPLVAMLGALHVRLVSPTRAALALLAIGIWLIPVTWSESREITAFLGVPILAVGVLAASLPWPFRRAGTQGACPLCGYSLRGLGIQGKCPECSTPFLEPVDGAAPPSALDRLFALRSRSLARLGAIFAITYLVLTLSQFLGLRSVDTQVSTLVAYSAVSALIPAAFATIGIEIARRLCTVARFASAKA